MDYYIAVRYNKWRYIEQAFQCNESHTLRFSKFEQCKVTPIFGNQLLPAEASPIDIHCETETWISGSSHEASRSGVTLHVHRIFWEYNVPVPVLQCKHAHTHTFPTQTHPQLQQVYLSCPHPCVSWAWRGPHTAAGSAQPPPGSSSPDARCQWPAACPLAPGSPSYREAILFMSLQIWDHS